MKASTSRTTSSALTRTRARSAAFRADFYNVFNHGNFYVGDQNVNSVNFGKIRSQFYSADGVGPRLIQFGLYYKF